MEKTSYYSISSHFSNPLLSVFRGRNLKVWPQSYTLMIPCHYSSTLTSNFTCIYGFCFFLMKLILTICIYPSVLYSFLCDIISFKERSKIDFLVYLTNCFDIQISDWSICLIKRNVIMFSWNVYSYFKEQNFKRIKKH